MLKTVKVKGFIYKPNGEPAKGAKGRATLSSFEVDEGIIVPKVIFFSTDEDGYFEINAWPNERGSVGSHYELRATLDCDRVIDSKFVVPDVDYEVDILSILDALPYPPIDEAREAVLAAKQHAEAAKEYKNEAKVSADDASESASVATDQANQATQSATEAATSASQAADIVSDVGDALDAVTALRDETEGFKNDASIGASSASSSASIASNSATTAQTAASTATTKADEASTSASEASSSAAAASNSAGDAASSATESMGYKEAAEAAAQEAADNAASVDASVVPLPNRVPKSNSEGLLDDGWMNLAPLRVQVLNALYPDGIYPSLDLRFVGANMINNPDVNFERASKATYWDSNGILREADIDEPRFTYDPVTGEALGLLLEAQATNLLPVSIDVGITSAGWTSTIATVSPTPTPAPDGGTGVTHLVPSSETTAFYQVLRKTPRTGATQYTFSIFVKNESLVSGNVITLQQFVSSTDLAEVEFDANTYEVLSEEGRGNHSSVSGSAAAVGNGWNRLRISFAVNETVTSLSLRVLLKKIDAETLGSCYLWGAQLEEGTSATSYIPTEGTEATRAADIITYAKADNSPLFPSGEFSCVIDYDATALTPSADRIAAYFNGTTPLSVKDANTLDGYGNALPSLGYQAGRNKVSFAVDANRKSGSHNGGETVESLGATAGVNSTTQVNFSQGGVAQNYNGHLRSFQLYSRALPDTKLQELSSL